ncbi:MAG: histidinol dehydrogenase [Pseudomonadota bacterium]
MIRLLKSTSTDFTEELENLLLRESEMDQKIQEVTASIIADVRRRGDEAVQEYTNRFDQVSGNLELPLSQTQDALKAISKEMRGALEAAHERILFYHQQEVQASWQIEEKDGTVLGQKISPLDRVGVYVPGGKAAYPSSVLMTVVPAKVAGVKEIIMVVPTPGGDVSQAVLAAAAVVGVNRVFTIGGAQAIAALAYGTETIPAVDKIVGPGNAYVAAAKRLVFGKVGIDMIAGPSEVLVIADETSDPDWIAMDLFAQAEHDELAQSILLTTSDKVAAGVLESIKRLLPTMPRKDIIQKSLLNYGALIVAENNEVAASIANRIAPEHLELMVEDVDGWFARIHHAGAIFCGRYSAESLGDYCAGPNHVLPTAGTARFSSPLGVYDFQKRSSIIQASRGGADKMAAIASKLARSEGLFAHACSAEYRLVRKPENEITDA